MVSDALTVEGRTSGMTATQIQPLREGDLALAGQLMYRAVNLVRERAGLPPLAGPGGGGRRPLPLMNYIFSQGPELSWGAYDGRTLAGFLVGCVRDRQWHVAYLFVDPEYQGLGIGRDLLSQGFGDPRVQEMHFFSQCAPTHDLRAIGLASHFGMFPRKTLLLMRGTDLRNRALRPRSETVVMQPIASVETVSELNRMDCEVRGVNRAADHCFWLSQDDYAGFVFAVNERTVGYAYISRKGAIGPVLAARDLFMTDLLVHCLHEVREQKCEDVHLWVCGKNFIAIQLLLESGLRFEEIAVLMTNRVFCDLRRYLPHSLVLF